MMIRYGLLFIVSVVLLGKVADARPPQKIVGGQMAALGEFPYQVSLRIDDRHVCGGAIISNEHILTAAHCVVGLTSSPFTNLVVVTGSVKCKAGHTHVVKSVLYDPKWVLGPPGLPHDLAVIKLANKIKFDAYQNKIALPKSATPSGVVGTVTGWGLQSRGALATAEDLMKLQVTTLGAPECHRRFAGKANIYPAQICSLCAPGRGFCQGDSGGPLVVGNEVVGIVSFNFSCGTGFPDVYTGVHYSRNWIEQVMRDNILLVTPK